MLSIPINLESNIPMYEQIYQYIKSEISHGALSSGEKLPSTRSLASYLHVSRNTVDMAYAQLLSEGYIDSYPKKGYYINEVANLKTTAEPIQISTKKVTPTTTISYDYDFSPFSIDLKNFPFHTWQKLMKACLADNQDIFLLGDNQGDFEFRRAIQTYIHQSRGVNCSINQIIIGAGADYLLQLLAQLFTETDLIAMEDPAYKQAFQIFEKLHFKTTAIPVDHNGIQIDKLRASGANIVYVTPSHQFPLGVVMPIHRRMELLKWAMESEHHYIIEDDHDSEFRYKGKPIPSLQGIDTSDKVIYIGTFSRSIAPAIRIGYMVLPKPLLHLYENNLSHYSSTVSRLDQQILTTFIEDGYFERHLNRMRKHYKLKHDAMLQGLKAMQSDIQILGEHAGLHIVVTINTTRKEEEILNAMNDAKIKLYPLSIHYLNQPKDYKPTFLMGYANMNEMEIMLGLKRMQDVLLSLM